MFPPARFTLLAIVCAAVAICVVPAGAAAFTAPDPGGDPNATVQLPPPGGKYMGFNDDSISDLHGLTETDYAELSRVAGGNLIRASFDWRSAEPSDDYWRYGAWSAAKDLYDRALERGMTPMFTVGFAPTWARDDAGKLCGEPCRLPPSRAMDGEWGEFVGRVAEQFPRAIIEVWNEPNLSNFWKTGADPQRYAELLNVAHDAVKAVSPSTTVLGGGLSNVQVSLNGHMAIGEFLSRAYAASPSIAGNMDALSFHPYPDAPALGLNTLFAKSFDDVRRAKAAAGDSATPLFVSEVGISLTGTIPVTEAVQADAMLSAYRRLMTMDDVIGVVFHRLIEPADTTGNLFELGAGWLRYGGNPPSARAVYCRFVAEAGHTYPSCPDSAPPETTITGGTGAWSGTSSSFEFASSEPGSTFECKLDAGAWAACSSPRAFAALPAGAHTFSVRALDPSANVDPTPAARSFRVDTTAPASFDIVRPKSKAKTGVRPTVTWRASSDSGSGVAAYEIAFDGTKAGTVAASATQFVPTVRLSAGKHTVVVTAVDAVGNRRNAGSKTFTARTDLPETASRSRGHRGNRGRRHR